MFHSIMANKTKSDKIAARMMERISAHEDFKDWLDTFLDEKKIDLDHGFSVPGKSGNNHMTYGVVVDHIKAAPKHEQDAIKNTIVKIDLHNGDVTHYLRHLAQAIAI